MSLAKNIAMYRLKARLLKPSLSVINTKPGDTLLIHVDGKPTQEEKDALRDTLLPSATALGLMLLVVPSDVKITLLKGKEQALSLDTFDGGMG